MSSTSPSDNVGAVRNHGPKRGLGWLWWLLLLLLALVIAGVIIALVHHHHSHQAAAASSPSTSPAPVTSASPTTAPQPTAAAVPGPALVGGGGHPATTLTNPAAGTDGTVLFRSAGTAVDAAGQSVVAAAARLVSAQHSSMVTVTGYTDVVAGQKVNTRLAGKRARVVASELRHALGSAVTVTTRSRGQHDPVASNRTAAGRAQNRRAVITAS